MIPYADGSVKNNFDDEEYVHYKKVSWRDKVLLNRPSKVVLSLMITSVILPILLYTFVLSSTLSEAPSDGHSFGSCLLPRESRLPCGVGYTDQTHYPCHQDCCYDQVSNFCFHRLPSRFSYIMEGNWTEELDLQPRVPKDPFSFQPSLPDLRLFIDEISATHLSLHFYNSRLVPPMNTSKGAPVTDYSYTVSSPELNVQVDAPQGTIFNTMRGPLIAANNIWEISFKLTDDTMYGFGQIPMVNDTVKVLYNHKGGFSGIPLIYAKINTTYHGLLIDVDTPTEVSVQGDNMIVIRSITSSGLKFHLFVGPEPVDVMRDVMKLVGTAIAPDYWMLGAHVCHSEAEETIEEAYFRLESFLDDANINHVPYESHCGVTSMVFNNDDEYYTVIEKGVEALEKFNKKFVPHVSPFIRYHLCDENTSSKNDCNLTSIVDNYKELMLRDSLEIYIGLVNDMDVVYPDYDQEATVQMIDDLWNFNSTYYAMVLENSWPLDESLKMMNVTYAFLPYSSSSFEDAFKETPPGDVKRPNLNYYIYTHNRYGEDFHTTMKEYSQDVSILTTNMYMNGRAMINRQNIQASWVQLQEELVEMALGSVSGNWFISSPICGDMDDFDFATQKVLCVKWYQAATFFPMIKIQSESISRFPTYFEGSIKAYTINALKTRLSLLPYFYTVLQDGPLLRPMFFQFPETEVLANLTSQFAIGDSLLMVPDLLPSQTHTNLWMPPGSWYELWSGLKINAGEGEAEAMTSTVADILALIRGGSIIFLQKHVEETAEETRRLSNYSLIIALQCSTSEWDLDVCNATGKLFLTNNLTIKVEANSNTLTLHADGEDFSAICHNDTAISARFIEDLNIYGLRHEDNNFDHHKHVDVLIDLCDVESNNVQFRFN